MPSTMDEPLPVDGEDVAGRHSPSPPPATAESSATPFRSLPVPPASSGSGVAEAATTTNSTSSSRPISTTASCSATKMKIRVRAPQTEAEESEWREFFDLVVEILLEQTDQRLMFAKLRPLVNARKLEARHYPPRPYAKFRHFFGDVVAFFNKKERCSDKVIELASTAGGSEPVVCLRSKVGSSSIGTPNNRVEDGAGGEKSCDAFTSGTSYAQQSSHENPRNSSSASSSSASSSETSSRSQKKKPGTGSGSSNKQDEDQDANAQTKEDAAAHDRRKSKAGRPSKKIKRKRAEEQRAESESPSGAEAGRGTVEQLARPLHQEARKRGTSKADITSSSRKPPGKVGGKTTSTSSKNKNRDPPPPSSAYEYPPQSANKGRGKTQRQHTWHAASWGAPPQQTHADSTRSYSSTYAASYQHGHGAPLGGGSSFLPHHPPTPSYHDGADARSFIPRTAHDHGDGAGAAVAADAQPVREGDANFSYESAVYYAPDGNVYGFFPLMVQQQPVAPDGHAAQHAGNVTAPSPSATTTAHNENQLNGASELSTLTLSQLYLQHQQHHILAGSNHDHVGAASMQAAGGAFFTGTDGASNEAEISSFASSPGLFVPTTGGGTGATGGLLAQTVRSQQSQSSAITSSPNFMGMLLPENFEQHTPGGPATSSPGALNFAPAERQTTNTKPNSFLSSAALEFVPAKEAVGVSSSNSAHVVVARPSLESTSKPSGEVDEAATAVAVQNGKTNEHELLVRAKSVNVVADCEEKEVANVSSSSSSSPAGGGRARASAPPTSTPASPSRIPSEREGTPEDGANEEMTAANSPQQKQQECQEAQLIQLQVQVNQLQEQLKCLGAQNQSLDRNCKTLELKFEASSYSEARLSNQLRKQKIENAELKKRLAVFNQKAHETYIKSLADANWWNAHISSASTDTDTPAGGGSPSPTTTSDAGAPVAPSSAVNGLGNRGGRGGNPSHSHQTQLIALHLPNAVSGGGGAPVLSSPLHVGPPLGMAISPVAEVDAEDNLNASNSGGSSVTGTGGGAGEAPAAPAGGGSHHGQQGGGNNVMPIGTLSLNSKATGGAPPSAGGSSSSSSTGGATVRNLLSAATLGALPLTLPSNATSSSSSPPGAGAQHQGGPHGVVPASGGPPAAHGGTTTNIVPHSTNHEFQHQMVFAHPVLKSSVPPSVSVHSFDFRSAQTSGASSTATFLSGQHTPRFFPAGAMGGVVTPGGISSGGTTGAAIGTLGGTIMQVRDDRIIIPQGIVQQKKGHFSK